MMNLSILITNFNYGHYLDKCIRSCLSLKRPYPEFKYEILVVDDGSTDASSEILKKYDNSVDILRIENSGVEFAANSIYKMSKGDFIVRLDADDLFRCDFLETIDKTCQQVQRDDQIGFIYTNYEEIDEDGEVIKEIKLPAFSAVEIAERGDFLATGTVIKRSVLPRLLYSEDEKNCGLENYKLILALVEKGYKGVRVNANGFFYRRHNKSLSSLKKEAIVNYGNKMMSNFSFGEFKTNKYHPYNLIIDSAS